MTLKPASDLAVGDVMASMHAAPTVVGGVTVTAVAGTTVSWLSKFADTGTTDFAPTDKVWVTA